MVFRIKLVLSCKLGCNKTINQEMTLAGIYNQNEANFADVERKRIGFRVMEN
jgi:hypothetical protein